jgi:hypothetical protein
MRRWLLPIALLVAPPAWGQELGLAAVAADSADTDTLAAAAIELAASTGWRTAIYAELDDQRNNGQPIVGMSAVSSMPDTGVLVTYSPDQLSRLLTVFNQAAPAHDEGWRTILIFVENGEAFVVTGPRAGPIEGFNDRQFDQVIGAFRAHPRPE